MVPCGAVCCSVVQRGATWCRVVHRVALCRSVLQCVAVCCSVLQCVVVCCNVLQCAAVCCSVLQCMVLCGSIHWWIDSHISDMALSYMTVRSYLNWILYAWQSFTWERTHAHAVSHVRIRFVTCDTTHAHLTWLKDSHVTSVLYVRHDSFIRGESCQN